MRMAALMVSESSTMEELVLKTGTAWPLYLQRLEFCLVANGIVDSEKKRAVLCVVCKAVMYAIIRSLCLPALLSQASYEVTVLKLTAHFNPRASIIVQRF